jgi:hypothetical protein
VSAGAIRFQVADGPVISLQAGDAFHEPANVRIPHFDNASDTEAAVFIACYLLPPGERAPDRADRKASRLDDFPGNNSITVPSAANAQPESPASTVASDTRHRPGTRASIEARRTRVDVRGPAHRQEQDQRCSLPADPERPRPGAIAGACGPTDTDGHARASERANRTGRR